MCEFKVGMKINGVKWDGEDRMFTWGGRFWLVEEIEISGSKDGHLFYDVRMRPESGYSGRTCVITYRDDTIPIPWEDESSKDFPHMCMRCGKKAYVGFLEVQHMETSTCPARSK